MNGSTLIGWGFKPGRHFGDMLKTAQELRAAGATDDAIVTQLQTMVPVEIGLLTNDLPFSIFLEPETDDERANLAQVVQHVDALVRTPTIVKATILPDACPTGEMPVGTVVATKEAIHPGFHSADICCSMAMSVFKRFDDPTRVLDVAQAITHFGRGRRAKHLTDLPSSLIERIAANPFTKDLVDVARGTLSSQGDGNHFLYFGRRASDGKMAIVTHHGSRNFGALLYKQGMAAAQRHTAIVAPRVPKQNAWLDSESEQGADYWDALQIVRDWTHLNHTSIHDAISATLGNRIIERTWNEHNFVFRRDDGLFYHGKGATPSYAGFAADDTGQTLIPLNMAEPILVTEHTDRPDTLGFAPHGAGRNMSRTRYLREVVGDRPIEELMPKDIDVRFYVGVPDLSELPGAYKNADQVRRSIEKHKLARVVDQIDPIDSIMAGNEPKPWLQR